MSTMFGRGLRRLFGIKPKKKKRSYVYEYKPKIEAITLDSLPSDNVSLEEKMEEIVKKTAAKKAQAKKKAASKKKAVSKKTATKKKTAVKKKTSKKKSARKK